MGCERTPAITGSRLAQFTPIPARVGRGRGRGRGCGVAGSLPRQWPLGPYGRSGSGMRSSSGASWFMSRTNDFMAGRAPAKSFIWLWNTRAGWLPVRSRRRNEPSSLAPRRAKGGSRRAASAASARASNWSPSSDGVSRTTRGGSFGRVLVSQPAVARDRRRAVAERAGVVGGSIAIPERQGPGSGCRRLCGHVRGGRASKASDSISAARLREGPTNFPPKDASASGFREAG